MDHFGKKSQGCTPKKQYSRGVVVEDINVCWVCSKDKKQKLYVFKRDGSPGSAKKSCEQYLGIHFAPIKENYGCHVCQDCKRCIESYNGHKEKVDQLGKKIASMKNQVLQSVWSNEYKDSAY